MLWMYLHFHQLQLDCLQQTPDTLNTPMGIYEATSNKLVQLNDAAKKHGLRIGMGLASASARCQHLRLLAHDPKIELDRLTAIANKLYLIASDIALCEHQAIAIKLDNMLTYYQGIKPLIGALSAQLKRQNVHFYYATGWSIEAAEVMARAAVNKITTDPQQIRQLLGQCDLTLCRLNSKQVNALHRVGIRNLQALMSISTQEIGKRFDNSVLRYLTALRGESISSIVFYRPAEHFRSSVELPYEIEKLDQLLPWYSTLYHELETYLMLRNKLTSHTQLILLCRDEESVSININAAQAQYRQSQWLDLAVLKNEQVSLASPVRHITLVCRITTDITEQKSDLFDNRQHQFAHLQLLGHLQAKLGESSVKQPQANDDFRPDIDDTSVKQSSPRMDITYDPFMPSFVTETPLTLNTTTRILYGPRRIQTAWWEGEHVYRDYFVVEDEQGQYLWVFRDNKQQWFIHGWYS